MKKDPWGNDYQYVYPGTHGTEYDLFTLGADNQPGGEGINADIGNWSLNYASSLGAPLPPGIPRSSPCATVGQAPRALRSSRSWSSSSSSASVAP